MRPSSSIAANGKRNSQAAVQFTAIIRTLIGSLGGGPSRIGFAGADALLLASSCAPFRLRLTLVQSDSFPARS